MSNIKKIRKHLIKKLSKLKNEKKVLLDFDTATISKIIFNETGYGKFFALPFETLKKIDFSTVPFKDVNVTWLDFSNLYGVRINPQEVYNKDMSHTKLENVTITGSFDDVILCDTSFKKSIDAVINLQTIRDKSIEDCVLEDAYIEGSFDDVYVKGVNFTNCKNIILLNPQDVRDKNLNSTVLDGVTITGSFDSVKIISTNFKKSKGAVIKPMKLWHKNMFGAILCDAYIEGDFDGVYIVATDFEGCKGRLNINPQDVYLKYFSQTKLNGVTITGPFDDVYLNQTDFKGSIGAVIDASKFEIDRLQSCNLEDAKVIYNDDKIKKKRLYFMNR